MADVFIGVVVLIAGWGLAVTLRDQGSPLIVDLLAGVVGLAAGRFGVAGLFGPGASGPLPAALTAMGGIVLLLAVRGMAPQEIPSPPGRGSS